MSSIDVLETRDRLVDTGVCQNGQAEPMAVLLDDLFDQALATYVRQTALEQLIEQWRVERAEMAAEQAQFMADIRSEMNEIRKEISEFREESNARERERDERDERERQRDERERQRVRDQEDRDSKMRQWVIGAVSVGFAATTLAVGLLVAFG